MGFSSFARKAMPWITTAVEIAAPGAAPLVNLAAKTISSGLQKTVAPDATSIENAISTAMATPEQLAQLKKIDDDFAVQMKQLDIQSVEQLAQIAELDRASARDMQVATKSWAPGVLAASAVVTLLICIYLLGFRQLPDSGHDALLLLIGALVASYKDVYGYYFGSSAGSDAKTSMLANQLNGNGKSH